MLAPARAAPAIVVFAAASLRDALDAAVAAYDPGGVTVSYAGSSALAKQIEAGAPAELFISADDDWMDYLAGRGRIDAASRVALLGNDLVLVAAPSFAGDLAIAPGFPLAAALGDGRLSVAATEAVPAGRYAKAALQSLGVWDSVAGRLAESDNVRTALQFVSRGEAPLGIVYATDARVAPDVRVLGTFPEDSHPPIRYPAALMPGASPGARALPRLPRLCPRPAGLRGRGVPGPGAGRVMFTPAEAEAIRLSLWVAGVATLVALPISVIVALVLARGRFPGRLLLDAVVHLPLVLPPVVTGYLLLVGFGRNGPFGTFFESVFGLTFAFRWTGAALAAGIMGFPLLVRAVRLSVEAVDRRLEEAAGSLGAHPLVVFATVTLPLIVPGLVSGAVLIFAKALGEFGATITFVSNIPGQTQTLPTAIYSALQVPGGEPGALRLSLVAIAISLAALAASELMARRMRARAPR